MRRPRPRAKRGRRVLEDVDAMRRLALARFAPDSNDPGVVRQRSRGKLTCRERIDLLLDAGTFREVGSVAGFASYDEEGAVAAFTPANHVGGWGSIEGTLGHRLRGRLHVPGAATRTERSARRAVTSTAWRSRCAFPRCACSTAPPGAAAWPRWCRNSARRARAGPRRAAAPSRRDARGSPAAADRSCRGISAVPCTPSNSVPSPWSTCCSAAWSASARRRRYSGISP